MLKTKYITWKDYLFSFRRGGLSSFSTAFKQLFKGLLNSYIGLRVSLIKKSPEKFDKKNVTSILIYFPEASGLGDMIIAGSFFKMLRNSFRHSKIILLAKNNLFVNPDFIDDFVALSGKSLQEQKEIISRLSPDLLLLPEKSVKGSLLALHANVRFLLGYFDGYTLRANFKINKMAFHPAKDHYYLKSFLLFKALADSEEYLDFKYIPDINFIKTEPKSIHKPYIVFIPSVLWNTRTINYEQACVIVQTIIDNGFHVLLCGGSESKVRIKKLSKDFHVNKNQIICKEDMSLPSFVSHIKHANGVICGDSGPMHIALGFDKKVFSYWGPTNPMLRLPELDHLKFAYAFEEKKCAVKNCYNMEHAPLCKSCLRLDELPDLKNKLSQFLQGCA